MDAHESSRRGLVGVLAAATVLAVAAAAITLVPRDGAPGTRATAVEVAAQQQPTPEPTAATGQPEVTLLPIETYEVFLARDPFRPVRPAEGGTGGTTGGTTTGTTTTGTTTTSTTTTGTTTTGTTTTDGTTTDGSTVVDGVTVELVDVIPASGSDAEHALVRVDSELFDVTEGQSFANNFMVISIDPPCVTLLFGDDMFTLCEGERVLK